MHDSAILKVTDGSYTDIVGKVTIGNSCFIGWGSIILPGVYIADNTIVAAGVVVIKSIKGSGYVLAGNPAVVIGTVNDYVEKNKKYAVNLNGLTYEEKQKILLGKKNLLERTFFCMKKEK